MPWTPISSTRWSLEEPTEIRHLLLKAGTRYVELHGAAVHVYDGPATVGDAQWPLGGPDAEPGVPVCTWVFTASVNVATEDEAWAAMADPRFTVAAAPEPELPGPSTPAPPPPALPPGPPPTGGGEDEEV